MKRIFGILLALLPFLAHAEVITPQQAHATAARFFQSDSKLYGKGNNLPLQLVWTGQPQTAQSRTVTEEPPFYVFNRGEEQGFIIIAADNAAFPVLGYSFRGSFETENMPVNLKAWMEQLAEQMSTVRQLKLTPTDDIRRAWSHAGKTAEDEQEVTLETPLWDQDSPYNLQCPVVSDRNCYTGCTITATCIVMGYHQWPDHGEGTLPGYITYPSNQWEVPIDVAPVELGETYDWSIMPGINGNSIYDIRGEHTISSLMYHVGVMSKANFSIFATDAQPYNTAAGLSTYMKYRKGIRHLIRDCFSEDYWNEMMHREIDGHRPVVYDGYGKDLGEGHAFVLDGYRGKDFYSVNWGWGGRYNGFFYLSSLIPSGQGAGGTADGNFSYGQGGLFGVAPLRDGETDESYDNLMFIKYGVNDPIGLKILETEVQDIKTGVPFWFSAGWVCNMGNVPFKGEIKVVLTDAAGKIKETYYTRQFNELLPGNLIYSIYDHENNYTLITITQPIEAGDRLRMLYKNDTATEWNVVSTDPMQGTDEIVLKAGETAGQFPVRFEVGAEGSILVNGQKVSGSSYEMKSKPGETITFSVTPDAGYETASIQINGKEVIQALENNSYTLRVEEATSILVVFKKSTFQLTLNRNEGGYFIYNSKTYEDETQSFEVPFEELVSLAVRTLPDYRLKSVLFNNVDITSQFSQGAYMFRMTESATFDVTFEPKDTGISETTQNTLNVKSENGRLVIQGAEAGQDISIYTVDGKLLFSFTAQSPTLHLDLPKGAAYLIKSRNKSFKVML